MNTDKTSELSVLYEMKANFLSDFKDFAGMDLFQSLTSNLNRPQFPVSRTPDFASMLRPENLLSASKMGMPMPLRMDQLNSFTSFLASQSGANGMFGAPLVPNMQAPAPPTEASSRSPQAPVEISRDSESEEQGSDGNASLSATCAQNANALEADNSKRYRTSYSQYQTRVLEDSFKKERYISRPQRAQLAAELKLPENTIKVWFQNRRMKEKRQSMMLPNIAGNDPHLRETLLRVAQLYYNTRYGSTGGAADLNVESPKSADSNTSPSLRVSKANCAAGTPSALDGAQNSSTSSSSCGIAEISSEWPNSPCNTPRKRAALDGVAKMEKKRARKQSVSEEEQPPVSPLSFEAIKYMATFQQHIQSPTSEPTAERPRIFRPFTVEATLAEDVRGSEQPQ